MFNLNQTGEFSFALTGLSSKTKLCLYEKIGWKYKKVKGTSSKKGATVAGIDDILLDDGIYYLEVMSGDKGKGKFNTNYTLDITPDYLPVPTDNNNWNRAVNITDDMQDGFASLDGYVGFGDPCDCYKFYVDDLTTFDFDLEADDKEAKITVYRWDENKFKLKKVKSALEKHPKLTGPFVINQPPYQQYIPATIDNLSLDAGLYYVEVLSADKGKGKKNTEYDLQITQV